MEDNERWLSDGDCRKCRKNSYCSKACTVRKHNGKKLLTNVIREKTGLNKIYECMKDVGGEE